MVKHTQTVRQQITDELFELVWPFCGIAAQRVKVVWLSVDLTKRSSYFQLYVPYDFYVTWLKLK